MNEDQDPRTAIRRELEVIEKNVRMYDSGEATPGILPLYHRMVGSDAAGEGSE